MKRLILLGLLSLRLGGTECKQAPDVCLWNEAMVQAREYAAAEAEFSTKAQEFVKSRQTEIDTPGSVSVDTLKTSTTMWIAWQNLQSSYRKMQKAMHDFFVVEMNR